jgi:hypothetical protein
MDFVRASGVFFTGLGGLPAEGLTKFFVKGRLNVLQVGEDSRIFLATVCSANRSLMVF